MEIIIKVLIGFVAIEHLFFAYIEMLSWNKMGKKAFKGAMPNEMFSATKTMAANQGLYNLFLVAGLVWTFLIQDAEWNRSVSIFFLSCVAIAGIFGSITVAKKILYIQAFPALFALVLIYLS